MLFPFSLLSPHNNWFLDFLVFCFLFFIVVTLSKEQIWSAESFLMHFVYMINVTNALMLFEETWTGLRFCWVFLFLASFTSKFSISNKVTALKACWSRYQVAESSRRGIVMRQKINHHKIDLRYLEVGYLNSHSSPSLDLTFIAWFGFNLNVSVALDICNGTAVFIWLKKPNNTLFKFAATLFQSSCHCY